MKRFASYIIVVQLFILLTSPAVAQFQPTEVVRSQERTIVDGKIFYIHTVQKGHTLYSISKAYEVTQEEIKTANPQVDVLNLREGLAIRIPDSKYRQAIAYPENKEDFYDHDVRRGQTVYSLSKKYNVSEEVIYHYNPWARDGIKPNQTLWIPRRKEMQDISEAARINDLFYYYTTKDKDTLYSIAKSYGVNVSDIINANPELRGGLKSGQVLKIPKITLPEPELSDTNTLVIGALPCSGPVEPATYRIALLLPFFASVNLEELETPLDSLEEEGTFVPLLKQQGLRGRFFAEFYEGFLLALDSMKSTGLSAVLHVYDTERDTVKTKKIIRELSLVQPDLIVGPVYTEDVSIAGRLASYHNIGLVSPLSTKSLLVGENANIIQVIPSKPMESYAMANYLKQLNKGRIILIRGTDSVSIKNSWRFKKYFLENRPCDVAGNPLYFMDYRLNDSLQRVLGKILSKEEENIIVVFSDYEPDVSKLVAKLYTISDVFPMSLFGLPSWQTWKSIDWIQMHTLRLHLLSPFFTDYKNPQIRNYLLKSRYKLGYEPYEISPLGYNFSMLGYDIGFYFLSALKQYGRNFNQCIDQVEADQLLTNFNFQKVESGGYVNNSYNVISYNEDFTVEKIAIVNGLPVMPVNILPVPEVIPDTMPQELPGQKWP